MCVRESEPTPLWLNFFCYIVLITWNYIVFLGNTMFFLCEREGTHS
jgi:hypothetical protein